MEDTTACNALALSRPPTVPQQMEALGHYGLAAVSIGSITTLTLAVLFIINVGGFIRNSPPHRWRLLCWVTSMTLVISFLALMTLLIPRAGIQCDTVKQIFLPFSMMHFIDLTLDWKGGQSAALEDLLETNTTLNPRAPPCCCLAICIPAVSYTKKKLRLMKAMVYQMPLVQLAIIVLTVLLTEAEVIVKGKTPDPVFTTLSVLNIVCFLMAMYAFNILTRSFAPHLTSINYQFKANLLASGIILIKLQNFILNVIAVNGAIPCIPPYTSRVVLQKSIDASLTLAESFILGVLTFLTYRRIDRQDEDGPLRTTDEGENRKRINETAQL